MAEIHWNKLGAYLKETQILGSIQNALYWDQNTGMPKKGASWRSEQLTYIAKILHRRNSSEEFSDLIQSAKNELLNIEQNSNIRFSPKYTLLGSKYWDAQKRSFLEV